MPHNTTTKKNQQITRPLSHNFNILAFPDGHYLDFSHGQDYNKLELPEYFEYGQVVYILMAWGGDNQFTTHDDFDLHIKDGYRTVDRSIRVQGPFFPVGFEACAFTPVPGVEYHVKIREWGAEPQEIALLVGVDDLASFQHFSPEKTITLTPPADNPSVITVGAVSWQDPFTIEPYSSQGPAGDDIIKPDLVAPDFVSTWSYAFYGYPGFPGTSAAAPHVAGACALVKQVYPDWSPNEIKAFLESSATDLGDPGKDNVYGSGLVDLAAVVPSLISPPTGVAASDGTYTDKIEVTWDPVPEATAYKVHRSTSEGGTKTSLGITSSTTYEDTTASSSTTYFYWVTAANAYGESDFSSYDTGWRGCMLPDAPESITYPSYDQDGEFAIKWASVPDVTAYELQRATDPSFSGSTVVYGGTATSWNESGLQDGVYYYRVSTSDSCGTSDWKQGSVVVVSSTPVPVISLSRTSISNSTLQGQNASTKSFALWNSGLDTLEYTITSDADWLFFAPNNGSSTGEHDTITIDFTSASMAPGSYAATITVSATNAGNSPQMIPVDLEISQNQPPIAEAGSDETVTEGDSVTLDASNSSDPDNGIASYHWIQTTGPSVTLSSPDAVSTTFTAPPVDEEAVLTFQLTVTDNGGLQSSDTCFVNVTPKASKGGGGGGGCFVGTVAGGF